MNPKHYLGAWYEPGMFKQLTTTISKAREYPKIYVLSNVRST